MTIAVGLLVLAVLGHYAWCWWRLDQAGERFPHPGLDPARLMMETLARLRANWTFPAVLVGIWAIQGILPLLWTSHLRGVSAPRSSQETLREAELGDVPVKEIGGVSVGHWSDAPWELGYDRWRLRDYLAGQNAVGHLLKSVPGAIPFTLWLAARQWLLIALMGLSIVALSGTLIARPRWMAPRTRRTVPGVLALMVLAFLALVLFRLVPSAGWALSEYLAAASGRWSFLLFNVVLSPLALLSIAATAVFEGMVWAAGYRLMLGAQPSLIRAFSRSVGRFWPLFGFLVLGRLLPLWICFLPGILAFGPQWYLPFLITALLLFVPWIIMHRRLGVVEAVRENFRLIRDHPRLLGWFALRFTAIMVVATWGVGALVSGIRGGMVSGLLGLLPHFFLFVGTLAVASLYLQLTQPDSQHATT